MLPFQYGGANSDLAALAGGLTQEIVTGLSRFRYLSVVASASAARLKGVEGDEQALGAKLGAGARGGYRWFLSRAEPLRAPDGTVRYWIGINLDIDERKQAEFTWRRDSGELGQAE